MISRKAAKPQSFLLFGIDWIVKRISLRLCVFAGVFFCALPLRAQLPAEQLFYKLRDRVNAVRDYTAQVRMRIDVTFLKIPQLRGTLYFKSPDKLKLVRQGGLSILPKNGLTMNMGSLLPPGGVSVIDAGADNIGGQAVRVIKVVPNAEASDIVLTKLWVDEARMLVLRAETTTRDNGTVKMDLTFGRYANLALPDRATLYLDVKDYKMPKGVTMDYGSSGKVVDTDAQGGKGKRKKGTIYVEYLSYAINTGLSDAVFTQTATSR